MTAKGSVQKHIDLKDLIMTALSSILIKDGTSVDDNHCSSRQITDKCLKFQDGLPCSPLLGGKVETRKILHF